MTRPRVRFGEGNVVQWRAELEGITPAPWRRLLVSERAPLAELHEVVQRAFGHLVEGGHQFLQDGVTFVDADGGDGLRSTADTTLEALELHPGARLSHSAETGGAPWQHTLTVEQVAPRLVGQRLPECVAAWGASPPEDCDGPVHYAALLAALETPLDPRSAEMREWLPQEFDPAYADVNAINARLKDVRRET